MITILFIVLAGLGFFAWGIAIFAAIQIVRAAPSGQRFATYGKVGWWQFGEIRTALGPTVETPIRVYKRAFTAFIVCVVVAMLLGTLFGVQAQN